MRRQHQEQLRELGKYDSSSTYMIRCGEHGKRKEEHPVEFRRGLIFFHGHGSISSPKALLQEAGMRGIEDLYGCLFLANLLLREIKSTEYKKPFGHRHTRRSGAMVTAEKVGLPPEVYQEIILVADRRLDHRDSIQAGRVQKTGMFGPTEMRPFPEYIAKRAHAAAELRHQRERDKIARVTERLRKKGVKLTVAY